VLADAHERPDAPVGVRGLHEHDIHCYELPIP
jgi:hypothetical protein